MALLAAGDLSRMGCPVGQADVGVGEFSTQNTSQIPPRGSASLDLLKTTWLRFDNMLNLVCVMLAKLGANGKRDLWELEKFSLVS